MMTRIYSIRQKIENWLDDPKTKETANQHMRWEALAILAETDSSDVSLSGTEISGPNNNSKLAGFIMVIYMGE
jgi:hypothetical protein